MIAKKFNYIYQKELYTKKIIDCFSEIGNLLTLLKDY